MKIETEWWLALNYDSYLWASSEKGHILPHYLALNYWQTAGLGGLYDGMQKSVGDGLRIHVRA